MFSISHVSALADLPAPVALCCHDAGSANLIAAWVVLDNPARFRLCAQGPAAAIFSRLVPGLQSLDEREALRGAACLLSGTGWGGANEHRSRALARERGIPSLAVLDHWVNYRMRFTRDGQEILPDAFVVTDPEAQRIARDELGSERPVLLWENRYLSNEVEQVLAASPATAERAGRLLVVLEPIRTDWQMGAAEPAEFRSLDYLIDNLPGTGLGGSVIRLRPHPSEAPDKYSRWIEKRNDARIRLSDSRSLAADIAWAEAVAGLNSYALVVARAAGRRAISYLPQEAGSCVLRYPGIELLREQRRTTT